MISSQDFFIILFLGILALASGLQIGWGIRAVRREDRTSGLLVLAQGFVIILLLVLLGDERFLPPTTSILDLAIVGLIFVAAILAQMWLLPTLVQDLGEENVVHITIGGILLVGGAALWLLLGLQDAPILGAIGGIFLIAVGLALFVPSFRNVFGQAFGIGAKTPKEPVEKVAPRTAKKRNRRPL